MPIYAYRCDACGHAKDVLQKLSDAPLTVCPQCGGETFAKQVTAAGFQLKGSGWYVTDFRGGGAGNKPAEGAAEPSPAAEKKDGKAGDKASDQTSGQTSGEASGKASGKAHAKTPSPPAAAPAPAPAATPAPAPATGGGGGGGGSGAGH